MTSASASLLNRFAPVVTAFAAAGTSAVVGVAVVSTGPKALIALCGIFVAALAAARFGLAAPVVTLAAGAVGAIPGLDSRQQILAGTEYGDLFTFALIGLLGLAARPNLTVAYRSRAMRTLLVACSALALLWLAGLLRTVAEGTPAAQGLRTGRDFLYLPAVTAVGAVAFLDRRFLIRCLIGVAAVVCAACAVRVLASAAFPQLVGTLVFTGRKLSSGEVTRLDGIVDDLAGASIAFGIAYFLIDSHRRTRTLNWLALAAVLVPLVHILLTQTRARYITIPLGLVAVVLTMRERSRGIVRVVAGAVALVVLLVAFTTTVHIAAVDEAISSVASRLALSSTPQPVEDDTVLYRQELARTMTNRLSTENAWPFGLGFLSPTSNYDPFLPAGSIRNPDVGVLNALMTLGVVGAVMLYGFVAIAMGAATSALRTGGPDAWMAGGAIAYATTAILSSLTLVTLFSAPGAVTTGLVLAVGVSAQARDELTTPLPDDGF